MKNIECPLCGCPTFYVKDPDDAYETYEFGCTNGKVVFSSGGKSENPEIREETETFCNRCAWHGKYGDLKKSRD